MEQFYVYALIDPRTDAIFYIGKGKGKRVLQHQNEKQDIHSNTGKLQIIEDLLANGLEVKHIFIAEQLSEETALFLERLLVYRIGRKIFDEGSLTNIVPGGRWHREASLFLKPEWIPSLEEIESQYPGLLSILESYPHMSVEFTGLRCPRDPNDNFLHVYNNTGEKIREWDIDYFIQIFGLGHALDLINALKQANRPIYAWNRIWSKTNDGEFESIVEIPYQDFDEIDNDFTKKIKLSKTKNEVATLSNNDMNGKLQVIIMHTASEISVSYYYPHAIKKHHTTYLNRKLNGKCQLWYANGNLKEETDYVENVRQGKRTYHASGNIEMIEFYHADGAGKAVKRWFDNGQVEFENNEDGTSFSYSKTGILASKGIRTGNINEGGHFYSWEYGEDGIVKKETKNYYVEGLLHGYERSFYDSGELKREVDYTKGHANKVVKAFKKNGDVSIK